MTDATVKIAMLGEPPKLVEISKLKEHPENARRGDVPRIAESIRVNGFYGSVMVNRRTGHVILGNHRMRAATEVGLKRIPVSYVDVDVDTERRILAVDNRTSDLASYDDSKLASLLLNASKADESLSGTGYEKEDLAVLLKAISGPAAFPTVDETIETKHACPKCGYEFS